MKGYLVIFLVNGDRAFMKIMALTLYSNYTSEMIKMNNIVCFSSKSMHILAEYFLLGSISLSVSNIRLQMTKVYIPT